MTDQELLAYEREHHDDPDILLPDRTREIADGIGSARRGDSYPRKAFISSL